MRQNEGDASEGSDGAYQWRFISSGRSAGRFAAIERAHANSRYSRSLNGRWRFHEPDYDVSDWDQISVPHNWQLEGYGNSDLHRDALPVQGWSVAGDWG